MTTKPLLCSLCLFLMYAFISCSDDSQRVIDFQEEIAEEDTTEDQPEPEPEEEEEEEENTNARFNSEVFDNVSVTNNIVYGANSTQGGAQIELTMDFYEPEGDTQTSRPLLVFAHGGGFTSGDKGDFSDFSMFFARSGYVVASINYRLIDVFPSEEEGRIALVNSIFDMKSAVRYLRSKANDLRIDTSNIFIGGFSSGAFIGLHYAYFNSDADAMELGGPDLLSYINANGGFEGNSGNPDFSSNFKGVINLSGALVSVNYIDDDGPILFSAHAVDDEVVPYLEGESNNSGIITQGSGLIHPIVEASGTASVLRVIEIGGHSAFFDSCADCTIELRQYLSENL